MKLEKLQGKSWTQVVAFMKDSALALALETSPEESEVFQTAKEGGPEAGAAAAFAHLFMRENGPVEAIFAGIDIYNRLSPHSQKVKNLQYSVAWAGTRRPPARVKFPIKLRLRNRDKLGGLANIMLFIGSKSLAKGSTSQKIAAIGIMNFLKE